MLTLKVAVMKSRRRPMQLAPQVLSLLALLVQKYTY
jgi:hypothetical protein